MALKDVTNKKAIASSGHPSTVVANPTTGLSSADVTAVQAAVKAQAQARTAFVAETAVIAYQEAMSETMPLVSDAFSRIDGFFFDALLTSAQDAYTGTPAQVGAAPQKSAALPEAK